MNSFESMLAFVKVAELGSFSDASQVLGVSKSTLSRRVARLEDHLGVRLLTRTTRKLSLTDVGRTYLDSCLRIISDIDALEASISDMSTKPQGRLRVTTPAFQGANPLADLFIKYMEEYPGVELEVVATNQVMDLIDEEIDVAMRAGALPDSTMIARKLTTATVMLAASPSYLKQHGRPEALSDLLEHQCLTSERHARWQDASGHSLRVDGYMVSNDSGLLHRAALEGHGMAMLPWMVIADDILAGKLEPVMDELMSQRIGFYLVYPSKRHVSPKVRAFVELSVDFFNDRFPDGERDMARYAALH